MIIDDCSRLAYAEVHNDERGATVAAFTQRALDWLLDRGIVAERLLTDNAWAYTKNRKLRELLRDRAILHKRTRPYTPRTNEQRGDDDAGRLARARRRDGHQMALRSRAQRATAQLPKRPAVPVRGRSSIQTHATSTQMAKIARSSPRARRDPTARVPPRQADRARASPAVRPRERGADREHENDQQADVHRGPGAGRRHHVAVGPERGQPARVAVGAGRDPADPAADGVAGP